MTKLMSVLQAAAVILFCAAVPAGAQAQAVAGDLAAAPFSADALDQLLQPIALYPDPLLAEILAAATMPAQIVMANRYINSGGDPGQIAAQPWDPSVQALAHYPTVLQWLDDNLPWTTQLGEAFLNQQQDVMASIQRLRLLAQARDNLPSTPQENVVNDAGTIEIEPANPELIYVPSYQWNTIYYNPGVYCSFGAGFPIGLWLMHDWDWRNHHLFAWGPGHPRPGNWWTQPPRNRVAPRGVAVWHGPSRPAAVAARSTDRGFAADTFRAARLTAPAAPASPSVSRGAPASRAGFPGVAVVPDSSRGTRVGAASPTWENLSRGMSAPATVSRPAPNVSAASGGRTFGGSASGGGVLSRGASAGGAFGGAESSSEARQSSVRGVESRSTMSAPSSSPSSSSRSSASSSSSSSASSSRSAPSSSSGSSRGK